MNLLIKSARIIDTNSKYHNKVMDVFIKNGKIEKIAKSIKSSKELVCFLSLEKTKISKNCPSAYALTEAIAILKSAKYREIKNAGIKAPIIIFLATLSLYNLTVRSVANMMNGNVNVAIVNS